MDIKSNSRGFKSAVVNFCNALLEARKGPYEFGSELKNAMLGVENSVRSLSSFDNETRFKVKASVGAGNWSNVAWVCVLDLSVTKTTQQGFYVSMLFNKSLSSVFIGLGLGVTAYTQSGGLGTSNLRRHVSNLRTTIKSQIQQGNLIWDGDFNLEAAGRLPDGYKQATVFTRQFDIDALPDDDVLEDYLQTISQCVTDNKDYLSSLQTRYIPEVPETLTANGAEEVREEFEVLLDTLFWNSSIEARAHSILRRKKNIILQGAPGVGKTFWADKLANRINETAASSDPYEDGMSPPPPKEAIFRCQFHQSTTYEDFVEGYRPTQSGGFELKKGIFRLAAEYATDHQHQPTVLIIDEINRGNISKIFGELLSLIEADKRNSDWELSLAYTSERFFVPSNLFIIGMMNTADKSLAVVDYALRRRFGFINVEPAYSSPCFEYLLSQMGVDTEIIGRVRTGMQFINEEINQNASLGAGFEIGHSYFIPNMTVKNSEAWVESVVEDELRPLLEEYFFDNSERVEELISHLKNG